MGEEEEERRKKEEEASRPEYYFFSALHNCQHYGIQSGLDFARWATWRPKLATLKGWKGAQNSTISNKRYPRRAVPLSNTYGGMCLGVCYPIIPDIQRSSHNPDITLSEIGFVLFGAKNTFAGKKDREEA